MHGLKSCKCYVHFQLVRVAVLEVTEIMLALGLGTVLEKRRQFDGSPARFLYLACARLTLFFCFVEVLLGRKRSKNVGVGRAGEHG